MKVRFETTGCRLNQIETESAAKIFKDKSFFVTLESLTSSSSVDDACVLCVINTCAVTQKAEQKDRRIIRIVLEKCPNATVVVTGCYAQLAQDLIKAMSNRIALLPGQLKSRIEEVAVLLEKYKTTEFSPSAFANELSTRYKLNLSLLRRLIRIRVWRTEPSHLYDLDYDIQLNAALDVLKNHDDFNNLVRSTKTLKELQEEAKLNEEALKESENAKNSEDVDIDFAPDGNK